MSGQPFSASSLKDFANRASASSGTGKFAASSTVLAALRDAAQSTGARFETLAATAAIESGMNPSAKAGSSSATGLFQFVDQTWLAAVKRSGAEHGLAAQAAAIVRGANGHYTVADPKLRQEILDLRKNPKVAADIAGEHLKETTVALTQSLGHAPDVAETYMAHFLGTGGATQMLKALQNTPARSAADVLPDAARANPAMFNGLSVSQFVAKVRGRVENTYAELGMAMPKGTLQFSSAASSAIDPASSGSDGWGQGSPSKLSTAQERIVLASLEKVFTQMDKKMGAHHNDKQQKTAQMPLGAMAGLAGPTLGL